MAQTLPTSGDGASTPSPALATPVTTGWTPPTLLDDAPATADAFGGGHARLARSLAGIIRDERGGRAIALTGTYGSGKSTVVQLAEAQLQDEHVAVFTFDAWSHSGDPLRRSFVEELVEFLDRRGWTTAREWKKDLLRLSRQRDKTRVKSTPKLTVAGGLVAAALLFVPLGTAMLAKNDMAAARGLVGAALLLLPIAIVVVAWARSDDKRKALKNLLPLLFRDRQVKTNSTTIRTPDPTTVEFRDVFRRVAGSALGDGPRTLVVVVDNLDRLQADEATAAWSVMRTFFDGAARSGWENRFWTVAPLDLDALAVRRATPDRAEPTDGVGRRPDDDLITKTFAVTLRVPPPVLSEWRDFFAAQLREAFPYWATRPGELRAVYDLFLRLRVVEGGPPTPRAIKSFVNRLGALDRQWRGEVSLRTLALYLLVGHRLSPDGSELTEDGFVSDNVADSLDADWQRELAAVHFNVEPEKAYQVLVGERIETAFETARPDEVRKLKGTFGLDEAVLAAVRDGASRWSLSQMASNAAIREGAGLDRTVGTDESWAELARKAIQRRSHFVGDPPAVSKLEVREGLAALIRNAPAALAEGVAVTVLRALSSGTETRVGEAGTTAVDDWVDAVRGVAAAVGDSGGGTLRRLDVPAVSAVSYLTTLGRIARVEDDELRGTLSRHARLGDTGVTPGDVTAAVVAEIESGTFHSVEDAVRVMPTVENAEGEPVGQEWSDIVAALKTAADLDYQDGSAEEVAAVVRGLLGLRAVPQAKPLVQDALRTLTTDALPRQLSAAEDEPRTLGALLLALLVSPAAPKQPAAEAAPTTAGLRKAADYKAYIQTVTRPQDHLDAIRAAVMEVPVELLRELAGRRHSVPRERGLHREVLAASARRADAAGIFDLGSLATNPEVIRAALGEGYRTLVRERVRETGVGGVPVTLWALHPTTYSAVVESLEEEEEAETYTDRVLAAYTDLSEDAWAEVITDWPHTLRLAVELAGADARVGPGSDLPAALLSHVQKVACGDRDPSSVPDETPRLYAFLPEPARDGFLSRLRAVVLDGGPSAVRTALDGPYGLDLARTDGWDPTAERVFSSFLPDVLETASKPVAAWVVTLLQSSPGLITAADRGLVAGLYDKVNGYYGRKNTTTVVKRELERIESLLAPHVPRKKRKKGIIAQMAEKASVMFGSSTPARRPEPDPPPLPDATDAPSDDAAPAERDEE